MRRKRLGIFVLLSLCSWVVISYFLFFYCPNCQKDDMKQNEDSPDEFKLIKLESNIQALTQDYKKLIDNIKKTVMKKKSSLLISKINESRLKDGNNMDDRNNIHVNLNENVIDHEKGEIVNNIVYERLKEKQIQDKNQNIIQENHDRKNINIYSNGSALELQMRKIAQNKLDNGGPVIAVLVISCNRVTVQRCLDQLLKWRPSKEQFPVIVSQDCNHQATTDIILSYGDQVTLIQQPDQSEILIPPKEKKFKGYFKIARHYGWALNQTFFNFKFDTAIVVEDDLDIASDFFEYFLGTYWLLKRDSTLWCVSAWNDNGKSGLVDESQPDLLFRTDFFPGLGWMLTSSLWAELSVKWPKSYWDDWIRKPEQRKDRACIRPELPRTKTFGKIGVSNGMFFEKHLKYIKLNDQFVSFTKLNLSYLLKDIYDWTFVKDVYGSPVVSYQELKNGQIVSAGPVRIPYYTKDQYKKTAKFVGLMDDFRSGVPRTAYRGVVTFSYKGRRVYLAPHTNWKAYDITWS